MPLSSGSCVALAVIPPWAAMADADEQEAAVSKLFVSEARVDAGPIIKRFQPKDRGRAHSIFKRTSHIVVSVKER